MKESGPVGGVCRARPLDPPMHTILQLYNFWSENIQYLFPAVYWSHNHIHMKSNNLDEYFTEKKVN